MHKKGKLSAGLVASVLLSALSVARGEKLTILVTKDSGYDSRGWFSSDYGSIYVSNNAKAYFYADVLSRITQPGMATTVYSATFHYYVNNYWENSLPYTIQAFKVTNDWTEDAGPVPAYAEGSGSYTGSQLNGWFTLDVKDLVQGWADGAYPNYGMMLTDTKSYASQGICSREGVVQNRPYFVIEYALSPIVEVNIPITKDSGYDWRGWISHDWGCVYASNYAKAYFYADILSQISAPGRTTRVLSASLNYRVFGNWENNPPYTIQAFRVAGDWSESTGPVPAYGEGYGTYTGSQLNGWFNLDVKNLVQAWVNGTYSNYGVMLTDTVSYASQGIATRENAEDSRPYFTVRYALSEVTRGHRILIQKGLQIQALAFPWVSQRQPGFSLSRFNESKFTGLNFWETEYPRGLIGSPPGLQWGRWTQQNALLDLSTNELPYLPQMVTFQYFDEPDIVGNPSLIQTMKSWFALNRQRYPQVITHTDIGGLVSYVDHKNFVITAQPDMVLSSWYPYDPNNTPIVGGSPISLYEHLQIWRRIGLEGLDGSGAHPIPYGVFNQTCVLNGRTPSESEFRLNTFAAWAFGYKYLCAFLYSTTGDYGIVSILFNGLGDGSPTPAFYQMVSLNTMSRNLGPALVRLISTDVRMKMGRHWGGRQYWYEFNKDWEVGNALPSGISAWGASADPYMTAISANNPGNYNTYVKEDGTSSWTVRLPGDVVIGYFKPLDESFDGSSYSNQEYFMVVNGLTDLQADAAGSTQNITIDFNFGSSGINSLQRMRRSDGVVETISIGGSYDDLTWTQTGPTTYRMVLTLAGGTGDLFKYNTGAPFVGDVDSSEPVLLPGDANNDGLVDVGDLGILAANYGRTSGGTWTTGDFNGDGAVDVGDLGILAAHYGQGVSGTVDYNSDYAIAFGMTMAEEVSSADETSDQEIEPYSCSELGLPLIVGLALMGLMLVNTMEGFVDKLNSR
jgi:hypothetical protein